MKKMSFKEFMLLEENKSILEPIEKRLKLNENDSEEKKEEEDDKPETDDDIKKKAKEAKIKDEEDLEKEVRKEAEKDAKKTKKVLLGIVDERDHDGEVSKGIILDTELPEKKIEDLETREDVVASGINAKKLKTIAEIAKHIKKLNGTIVYWFDFESDHEGDVPWKKVKV